MKRFDFGEILGRAWQIIWKFKVMWIFGILAGCGRSSGGSSGAGSGSGVRDYQPNWQWDLGRWTDSVELTQVILIIVGVLLFALLVGLLINAISSMGKIGLVRGTLRAEEGAETLSFAELWDTRYFGRLFLLNLVVGLAGFVIFLAFLIPLVIMFIGMINNGDMARFSLFFGALACLLPLFCVLGIAGWLLGIWIELSQNALVIEDLGVGASFRRGWQVFRANLANTIGMALILWVLSFAVNLIVGIPLLLVFFPVIFGVFAGFISGVGGLALGSLAFAAACFCVFLPVMLLVSGVFNAYQGSAWALTYQRLAGLPVANLETPTPATLEEPIPPAL